MSLLFVEALAGVISWSTAAWLFAINRTFMTAYFQQDAAPIKSFFTRDGLKQLAENMIVVLRWGLWMSPIINSFLRPMGDRPGITRMAPFAPRWRSFGMRR